VRAGSKAQNQLDDMAAMSSRVLVEDVAVIVVIIAAIAVNGVAGFGVRKEAFPSSDALLVFRQDSLVNPRVQHRHPGLALVSPGVTMRADGTPEVAELLFPLLCALLAVVQKS
jgi:hypothetical protein